MSVNDQALAQLFTEARTAYQFQNKPVATELLQRAYELASLAPTSMNCLRALSSCKARVPRSACWPRSTQAMWTRPAPPP